MLCAPAVRAQLIDTIAGGGPNNLPALSANLDGPQGVVVDSAGNLFIAASNSNRIFKVDTSGRLTVVAGNGTFGFSGDDGPATDASLRDPFGVALDGSGNLFIADLNNRRIRRVDAATGIITTVAGNGSFGFSGDNGPATDASLNFPTGVALDGSGNLFIADLNNQRIRQVDAATGIITTVAGNGLCCFSGDNGPASDASLSNPNGVAVDGSGNLFIADQLNNRIRRVDAATGIITTVAGNGDFGFSGDDGPATDAMLASPNGAALDGSGNLFIADLNNQRIRRVDAATGIITTVAGDGTSGFSGDNRRASDSSLNLPTGVAVDGSGNLFIADLNNQRIRRVDAARGRITTVAGNGTSGFSGDNGPASNASLSNPTGVAVDGNGNLFIADLNDRRIRRVDAATGIITTVAGNGDFGFSGDDGPASDARLSNPTGVAVDGNGNLFIADQLNRRIRRVDAARGRITTVAGNGSFGFSGDNGPASDASLNFPNGVALDGSGNLFIADLNNQRIRRVDAATGIITTVAGNGTSGFSGDNGPASDAMLASPVGVALDGSGNLFIADQFNRRIRRVDAATGIITTVAGNGTSGFSGDNGPASDASLSNPTGVALDGSGNLFIADKLNNRIRRVDAATGIITAVAGNGTSGFSGDNGLATDAMLASPAGVALDGSGNLFIADQLNRRIRRVLQTMLPPEAIQNLIDDVVAGNAR